MDIKQVVATYFPYLAGAGNVVAASTKELSRLGHHVAVLTPRYHRTDLPEEDIDGAHIVRLKALWRYGNAAVTPSLGKWLADTDILHLHVPFYFGKEMLAVLRPRDGTPLVITYHNDVNLPGPAGAMLRAYDSLTLLRILESADLVLVPSEDYGKDSQIASLRWSVLPNGVDLGLFRPNAQPAEEVIEFGGGRHVLLFVGGLDNAHDYKGLEDALMAMNNLPDHCLAVVGDGNRKRYYEDLAKNLSDRVRFFGRREQAELPGFYVAAEATLYPSRRLENFPLGVLESIACGTPTIVTTLVSSARQLITTPQVGFVVQPSSPSEIGRACLQIEERRANPEDRESCARAASGYGWDRIAIQLQSFYESLLR